MTGPVNIYRLSRIRGREAFNIIERHSTHYLEPKRTQEHEMESLRLLADEFMRNGVTVSEMDGFFYSFHIPHIGKEFDLIKFTAKACLNIELKSSPVSKEQIAEAITGAAADSKGAEIVPATKPANLIQDPAERERMIKKIIEAGKEREEASKKRQVLINTREELKELKSKLEKSKDFEVDFCKLTLKKLSSVGYNAEFKDMFNISNREILKEFCEWLDVKIESKLKSLEDEILR